MKWIGQHIWDFISRFRSDVYLEGIETGTIASGGNLGLDSSNKIVKAASGSGDLTITNAGDNRVVTSTSGTGLNAESTLVYDPTAASGSFKQTVATSAASNIAHYIDIDNTASIASSNYGINIDWDGAGSYSGSSSYVYGVNIDILKDGTSTAGWNLYGINNTIEFDDDTSSATAYGVKQDINGGTTQYGLSQTLRNHSGTGICMGINNVISDAASVTIGYNQIVPDGEFDFKIQSSADAGDHCTWKTGANGETTIETTDAVGSVAHLNLNADGNIVFKPSSGIEFKAAPVGCYNTTTIKVMPHEFLGNNDGGEAWVYDDTSGKISVAISNTSNDLSTIVKVPEGFSVTHINFHVDVAQTNSCAARSFNYTNGDVGTTSSGATPNTWIFNSGTNYQLVGSSGAYPLACDATTDLFLGWGPGSTARRLYGVTVTIANT